MSKTQNDELRAKLAALNISEKDITRLAYSASHKIKMEDPKFRERNRLRAKKYYQDKYGTDKKFTEERRMISRIYAQLRDLDYKELLKNYE